MLIEQYLITSIEFGIFLFIYVLNLSVLLLDINHVKIEYYLHITYYYNININNMELKNYIYVLRHPICLWYEENEYTQIRTQKIGSTQNPRARFASYKTYYPTSVNIYRLYKVDANCYELDDTIREHFSQFNIKDDGGIEHYKYDLTMEMLEELFDDLQIEYEIVDPITVKDWRNYPVTKKEENDFLQDFLIMKRREIKGLNICSVKPRDYQNEIIDKAYHHFITKINY